MRKTTELDKIAFSAELEPRYMRPKAITQAVESKTAGTGTPLECMMEKYRENGSPLSLAKAYDIRDEAVMIA